MTRPNFHARLISDIHLHPYKLGAGTDGAGRVISALRAFRGALDLNPQPNAILFGGDLFHQRGVASTVGLIGLDEVVSGSRPMLYAVTGNHEVSPHGADVGGAEVLARMWSRPGPSDVAFARPNVVYAYDRPHMLVVCASYLTDVGPLDEVVRKIATNDASQDVLVLCHNGVLPSSKARSPFPGELALVPDHFRVLTAAGFRVLVCAGHWHEPGIVVPDGNLVVPVRGQQAPLRFEDGFAAVRIGALTQLDWGDAGRPRGFWDLIYDGASNSWYATFTESTAPRFHVVRSEDDWGGIFAGRDFVRAAASLDVPDCLSRLPVLELLPDDVEETQDNAVRSDIRLEDDDGSMLAKYVADKADDRADARLQLGLELLREAQGV